MTEHLELEIVTRDGKWFVNAKEHGECLTGPFSSRSEALEWIQAIRP